jgi:hypothetical protein
MSATLQRTRPLVIAKPATKVAKVTKLTATQTAAVSSTPSSSPPDPDLWLTPADAPSPTDFNIAVAMSAAIHRADSKESQTAMLGKGALRAPLNPLLLTFLLTF